MSTNIRLKRLFAYLLDILVVSLLISLISYIKVLNPNIEKYKKAYNEYTEYVEANSQGSNLADSIVTTEYGKLAYKISKYSISTLIIEASVILLYFTLFPYFNNNQTIGKRLMKLEVVRSDEQKVTIFNHLFRSLLIPIFTSTILYTNIYNILNIICILSFKNLTYLYIISGITLILCIYSYIDVIFLLSSKKGLSLHDRITGTKVITKC